MDQRIQDQLNVILDGIVGFVPRLILAIIVLYIGFFIVRRLERYFTGLIERSDIDPETSGFLNSIIDIILKVIILLVAVSILGIKLSVLVGLLAAAGFAVGMALQGFLGNFAAGMTIVFFKPYRVGDWVEINDTFGKVDKIQIFNTLLTTPGDKTLVIPNGQVTDNIITNFSTQGNIRLEVSVLMGYEESYPKVERVIKDALKELPYILSEPAPMVGIESYDTHNIVVTVRPYIHPDDYWDATFAVNQAIKKAFYENNIKMAYSEGVELGPIGE